MADLQARACKSAISLLDRVALIIESVIGTGQYWDILNISVLGISIVLLTDYA